MKKILIVGAGFLQAFVIKKAKEMGYYTIAVDKNPTAVGFAHADEYAVIDIIDQNACLEYALHKKIDGVMTAATDYGVLSAAYIAEQMKLPGLDYKVAKAIRSKYVVRDILFKSKVNKKSQYYEISSIEHINEIIDLINFPVMVKPCDGSGSKAIKKVDSSRGLKEACNYAIKSSLSGKVIIEDFIEGKEYGVESFVYNGEIHILGIMDKYMTFPPYYAELGHSFPSSLVVEDKIKSVVISAIKALGINFGAVNMDILVTDDNRVFIVDVGTRMGGNLIGSHIIPLGTGIDYMGNLIRASVGDYVHIEPGHSKVNVATRLLALKPGRIISLPDFKAISGKFCVEIYHHLKIGNFIREYQNNLDGCGYIVAISDDMEEAQKRVEESKQLIDIGISRGGIDKQDSSLGVG